MRRLPLLAIFLLAGCSPTPRTNLLIVTLDTTRADHLGCYGNDRIRTPSLDRIAELGTRFENATAAVPITAPSHSTIMTGLYPIAHGLRDNGLFVLGKSQQTLAEMLARAGYATGAAVGAFPLDARFGLDQGFAFYDDRYDMGREDPTGRRTRAKSGLYFDERRAGLVNEAAIPWLEQHHAEPFFLWLHYFDAHQPHEPPAPYDQLYAGDLYDGEIAYADESLGEILKILERHGVMERTLVVVCADHGEGRGEHDETTHSMLLYQGTLRVPLLIRMPGAPAGRVVQQRVGTVDVTPTVLELLGLPVPDDLQGRSVASLVLGKEPDRPEVERLHYAETLSPRLSNGWAELRAVFLGSTKYVFGPKPELYDLSTDPKEARNLADAEPERAAKLRARLESYLRENARPAEEASVPIDEETRQRLMALGYLPSAGSDVGTIEEVLHEGGVAPRDRIGDINDLSAAKGLLYQGHPLDARELLVPMVERDPGNASYRDLLAVADLSLGLLDEAIEQVAEIRRIRKGELSEPLANMLVASMFQAGRRDEALALMGELQGASPSASGQYLLALLCRESGDEPCSAAALARALELDPAHAAARIDLAIDLAKAGRREDAEKELRRAVADNPYDARAFYNLGTFLVEEGDLEGAGACFSRAQLLEPSYLKARLASIVVDLELGEPERARGALEELERLAPGSEEASQARSLVDEAGG